MGSIRERGLVLIALTVACLSTTLVVGLLKPVDIIFLKSAVVGVNVELYTDSSCTKPLDNIDWGGCRPGTRVTRTIYIKNIETEPLSLTLQRINKASVTTMNNLVIMWEEEGVILAAGETLSAVFSLNIPEKISRLSEICCDFVVAGKN